MMHRILIVDDDPEVRNVLVKILRRAGLGATVAENGAQGLEIHRAQPADLIILDLMMPAMGGFEVLQALRPRDEVAVLILTAERQERKRLDGFRLGADDYLVKPFSGEELLARIQAILRRTTRHKEPDALHSGPFEFDRMKREMKRDGSSLGLTHAEYNIVEALLTHAGHALSRPDLIRLAWAEGTHPSERTVDVHVFSLRKKICRSNDPGWIQTCGSEGYCWVSPVRIPRR
ncbi:response regulator transcription factor [Mesoterricola silvestris]|uniref:DNA-binding response regulator n=1 Tax=Mesoterricola silvestris TaxID=2927979 RepID=A0AA48GQJ0_9BACT|nr:response regulator transcription factor [Mesoterricola silvestris]BDU72167.1 DNA-binding response regulator [Mesoterricola silvestris]